MGQIILYVATAEILLIYFRIFKSDHLSYLKDGDPSIADVIKVDGSLKRVDQTSRAVGIILVPVDAGGVVSAVIRVNIQGALQAPLLIQLGNRATVPHAVLSGLRADERVLVVVFSVVVLSPLHRQRACRRKKGKY